MTEDEVKRRQKPSRAREIAKLVFRNENFVLVVVLIAIIAGMSVSVSKRPLDVKVGSRKVVQRIYNVERN
ncbi:hypothetical protein ES704_03975 [subsurface metagenome]|jgi:hypothetical protein